MAQKKAVETVKKGTASKPWKDAFLNRLRATPNVTAACAVAGVSKATVYRYREMDPEFASEWEAAVDASVDELEDIARRRAEEGSDTLVIFLLKAHRPHKYRDNQRIEHAIAEGQTHGVLIVPAIVTPEQWAVVMAGVEKVQQDGRQA